MFDESPTSAMYRCWSMPTQDLAHQMGVMGLPVTVIVNPEGMEVARLIGGADWSAPETLGFWTR